MIQPISIPSGAQLQLVDYAGNTWINLVEGKQGTTFTNDAEEDITEFCANPLDGICAEDAACDIETSLSIFDDNGNEYNLVQGRFYQAIDGRPNVKHG